MYHVIDFMNEKWSFTFTIIMTINRFSRYLLSVKQKLLNSYKLLLYKIQLQIVTRFIAEYHFDSLYSIDIELLANMYSSMNRIIYKLFEHLDKNLIYTRACRL